MARVGSALLVVALGGAVAAFAGAVAAHRRPRMMTAARAALLMGVAATVVATMGLVWALVDQHLELAYVASQTRRASNGWYRLAGLWGGAEGSLLFFSALLGAVAGAVVVRRRHGTAERRQTVLVASGVLAGHLLALLAVADPFERLDIPAVRGLGLTPILEHPAMVWHPPILYLGLASTFGLLLTNRRRWATSAFVLLTVGLATGAHWAHAELGWGGYWGWDPVENTVLVTWLALIALLHLDVRPDRRARQTAWWPVAAAMPFVAVAFGSAVTRSGGLSSVHAFADSDGLAIVLGAVTVFVVAVVVWRTTQVMAAVPATDAGSERADARDVLLVPVGLATVAALMVVLGVAWPLVAPGDPIVDGSWFARTIGPLAVATLAATALSERRWSNGHARLHLAVAGGAGLLVTWLLGGRTAFSLTVGIAAGAAVFALIAQAVRQRSPAMLIAHLGLTVMLIGVAGTTEVDRGLAVLAPGESISIGGHTFSHVESTVVDGPRPGSERVTVEMTVADPSTAARRLSPSLISYPREGVVLPEVAAHITLLREVRVFVRTTTRDGLASVDIAVRPLISLVWIGAGVIALGGAAALTTQSSGDRTRAKLESS